MACGRPSSSSFCGLLITNLVFTDVKLGRGADATVFEVDWNGTLCAAKRLHEILLEDESPGGADKLISNFESECLTWSKLRHPGIVQFLGVFFERNSRLPVLIMEKMDSSLRTHLEDHSKEEFSLNLKAFVLRQVTQGIAYLHTQNPSLVHHDLSPNNVLLNTVSFVTKVSDFGMSRAINPSVLTRKSSIKGTQAFMPPEALHDPPQYNESLDVFSFGNIIISTLTHEWPNPGPPTLYQGDQIVGLSELQRRERYIGEFTAKEKQLFLPVIGQCLENRQDKRPSSVILVQELKRIESSLPTSSHVATPIEQLRQQLSNKVEECRKKDDALRQKDEERALTINVALRQKEAEIQRLRKELKKRDRCAPGIGKQLAAQKMKNPLRDWMKLGECQKVIQHSQEGGRYRAVTVNSEGFLVVTDEMKQCVHLLTKEGALVRSIGKGVLDGCRMFGVAFDLKGNVWVTVHDHNFEEGKVVMLSQDGRLLCTLCYAGRESDPFKYPCGVSVSPIGRTFICDMGKGCVTVHDEEGKFLFPLGFKGDDRVCFSSPCDVTFGPGYLVYVVDVKHRRVYVWSEEGIWKSSFITKYPPSCIATTRDNHLLITLSPSHMAMVYTVEGQLVHEFGGFGSHSGKFDEPRGVCVDDNGVVCVADGMNNRVQVF